VEIENDDTKGVWDYFIDERYFNIPSPPAKIYGTNIIIDFINPRCLLSDEQSHCTPPFPKKHFYVDNND
jgi:hypothetical protein